MAGSQKSSEWLDLPVGQSPIQAVLLVGKLRRPRRGYRFSATSQPGHLIQLAVSGRTWHEVGGRRYDLRRGSLIWYHEDEPVRGEVLAAPWVFYTVNFVAPQLEPPAFEQRVQRVGQPTQRRFAGLLAAWEDTRVAPAVRAMRVHAALLDFLSHLQPARGRRVVMDPSASLWWNLETRLRRDLSAPIDLARMVELTGRSIATITRSCRGAVGVTPMKRVKQIRLSLARGLVRRSALTLTDIAGRIGYQRVHEFSRDYRKHFGMTASSERSGG